MKIAWLIQGDEQYGIRSGSRALILALTRSGVDCPVLALGDGEFTDECEALGLALTRLQIGPLPQLTGNLTNKFVQFGKLMKKESQARRSVGLALGKMQADALHFRRQNLVRIGGRAAHDNKIRSFWHLPNAIGGGYPFGINRRIYQSSCKRLGVVPIANSRYTATTIGFRPVRPYVMYLAVDQDRFDPIRITSIERSSMNIDAQAVVCGIVGRLVPNKGQDRIVSAVLKLNEEGHNIHLLIVGGPVSGTYGEQIMKIRAASQWSDRIHMIGPVSDTERYYKLMDFSINCRIDPEPCGISVLESMMCSTPVLVHASGGPAETVLDGTTGWHYPSTSDADTRAGLVRAIEASGRLPDMGKAARKHAIANYSLDAQVRHYLKIVHDVIGEPGNLR